MKDLAILRDDLQTREKKMNSRIGLSFMLMVLVMALLAPIEEKANELIFDGVLGLLFILALLGVAIALVLKTKKIRKEFGYTCPKCDKTYDTTLFQVAIASRHCGNCGAQIRCEPVDADNQITRP